MPDDAIGSRGSSWAWGVRLIVVMHAIGLSTGCLFGMIQRAWPPRGVA